MNSITRTIFVNAHPASLVISVGAVMGGLNASIIRGTVGIFPAVMTLIFAVLFQISANLYHGYLDLQYGAGENISGMNSRQSRALNDSRVQLIKIMANGCGLLSLTAGMALFPYIGWLGVLYMAIILLLVYFYFSGPLPIVRTRWSVLFTFIFFGPIGVSGTAFIQNPSMSNLLPIVVYSCIVGLLAANSHIAIEFLCYRQDEINGKETLVTAKGGKAARYVYLINAILASLILMLRPSTFEFVSPIIGITVGLALLLTSIWAFVLMKEEPGKVSRKIRGIAMWQYIVIMIVMMCIVTYWMEFKFNIFEFR